MNDTAELDAYIDAGTALLGIPVRPEWRDAIRQNLGFSFDLARVVLDFALPDEADPAPVFSASTSSLDTGGKVVDADRSLPPDARSGGRHDGGNASA